MRLRWAILVVLLVASCPCIGQVDEDDDSQGSDAAMLALASADIDAVDKATSAWTKAYEAKKLGGDAYVQRLEKVFPASPNETWGRAIEQWVAREPRSYPARFLLGLYDERMAFEARGTKFANETTAKQFEDFRGYAQQARDQLQSSISLSVNPYPSYCVLIDVHVALGDGRAADAFNTASAADPSARTAWETYLAYLAPKWGGSFEAIDALLRRADQSALSPVDRKRLLARALVVKGDEARRRGDYAAAVDQFRNAYLTAPEKTYLWRLNRAAKIAREGGMYDRAIAIYGEVITADASNHVALDGRGFVLETQTKNLAGAWKDYLAAADAGDAWAQNRVGWWYMTGTGGTKDLKMAEFYFKKAAAQGNEAAKGNLERLAKLTTAWAH